MANKCLLIIPYFGKFNNYFQLFLNSVADKKFFDFLIVTDDNRSFSYPQNVRRILMSFDDFKQRINQTTGYSYQLATVQKLCDYKPVYGHIFEEELAEYSYWGHCDIDCIFGDLDGLVAPLMDEEYDKIFNLGHLTLYKNNAYSRTLYRRYISADGYSPIFSVDYGVKFDEEFGPNSINLELKKDGKKVYSHQMEADIYTKANRFYLDYYDFETNTHKFVKQKNLFVYDNGHVYNYSDIKGELVRTEFAYIHLQKRKMDVRIPNSLTQYKMITNAFEPLEIPAQNLSLENFKSIKTYEISLHYLKLRSKNAKVKLKRFFESYKGKK